MLSDIGEKSAFYLEVETVAIGRLGMLVIVFQVVLIFQYLNVVFV